MNKTLRDELMRLPADERVKLAHDLLDSVEEAPAVSGALLAEAKRRLAEHALTQTLPCRGKKPGHDFGRG